MERLTVTKEDMRTTLALLLLATFLSGACSVRDDNSLQPGLVAIHEGRYGEAESYFKGLLAKDPKNPYGLLNLGVAQARMGRIDEAAENDRLAVRYGEDAPVRSVIGSQSSQDVESTVAAEASEISRKSGWLNRCGSGTRVS